MDVGSAWRDWVARVAAAGRLDTRGQPASYASSLKNLAPNTGGT